MSDSHAPATAATHGYAPVNGLEMYCEIHGSGRPLVLLHGALSATGTSQAPTMVVIGDSDIVRPEHAVELFRLLGGGVPGDVAGLPRSRLAVLPGTTHVGLVDRADWLVSMITEFLDAPMPAAG